MSNTEEETVLQRRRRLAREGVVPAAAINKYDIYGWCFLCEQPCWRHDGGHTYFLDLHIYAHTTPQSPATESCRDIIWRFGMDRSRSNRGRIRPKQVILRDALAYFRSLGDDDLAAPITAS